MGAARYRASAGDYNHPRGRLRSLSLVDYPEPGTVAARSVLFLKQNCRGRGPPTMPRPSIYSAGALSRTGSALLSETSS